ncbi:glycosyltransferase family 1 protein [Ornithobacterium rhinotracheale]|uniref:glycosyltransferase family 4 protein n=1 Tax=Ornithobacterium rhinotracheale TaxID=28251 RepID=UPI00129C698F|nr:glycosyltransferase family 4 protein [Ornithobacterium rhinotracheale]MRJ07501.1 glycosyltransferase family 1 protein [Ornithobacterium rhinotracheale]UOH78095.1 glycosyltransferase family 4 protein [Ornithobacterium rhinotracheale]
MKHSQIKLFRTATVPISLDILLRGQLKFLNQFYEVTAVSGKGKNLEAVHQREGVRTMQVEMQRQISPWKDLISLIKMYRLLKKEKPTIIHSITPKAGLLSMVAGKIAGVPIRIHTFTGLIFPYRTGFLQKILILMDKILCACATHIFPEGEGVKIDLQRYNITKKPLEIIANGNINGIDTDYFSKEQISEDTLNTLRKQYNISQDDFVFCFVGRLVKDKGIIELIDAFTELNNPKTKLILVGKEEPKLDPLPAETIQKMNENPNIIRTGFQSDIRPFLALSHAFVFPSYREGFPNVVLQAQSMELPCIVTDISGSNEIIENNINGTIIPKQNTEELAKAMRDYQNNRVALSILQANTRKNIIAKYTQQYVWDCIHEKYQEILSKREL